MFGGKEEFRYCLARYLGRHTYAQITTGDEDYTEDPIDRSKNVNLKRGEDEVV